MTRTGVVGAGQPGPVGHLLDGVGFVAEPVAGAVARHLSTTIERRAS